MGLGNRALVYLSGTQYTKDATVKIELPKYPGIASDYHNIRFCDVNGSILPHWVEHDENGVATGNIWVKLPAIGEKGIIIVVEWGDWNSGYGNGDETFVFFDDFEGTSLDTSKWDVVEGTIGSVSDSKLNLTTTSIATVSTVNKQKFGYGTEATFLAKMYEPDSKEGSWWGFNNYDGSSNNAAIIVLNNNYYFLKNGTSYTYRTRNFSATVWRIWQIQRVASNHVRFYADGTLDEDYTSSTCVPPGDVAVAMRNRGGYNHDVWVDWVFVRKYLNPEPEVKLITPSISRRLLTTLLSAVQGVPKTTYLESILRVGAYEEVFTQTLNKVGAEESKTVETVEKVGVEATRQIETENIVGVSEEKSIETVQKTGEKAEKNIETVQQVGEFTAVGNLQTVEQVGETQIYTAETTNVVGYEESKTVETEQRVGAEEITALETEERVGQTEEMNIETVEQVGELVEAGNTQTIQQVGKQEDRNIETVQKVGEHGEANLQTVIQSGIEVQSTLETVHIIGETAWMSLETVQTITGLEILRTTARILDYKKNLVEYKSTMSIEYTLEHYAENGWQAIDADEFYAQLETTDKIPQKIADLTVQKADTGKYIVYFHATEDVCEVNGKYYVALYWQYAGQKECERVLVVVVADVR